MEVVLNACYGGFGISPKARELMKTNKYNHEIERHDPLLVRIVKQLGKLSWGDNAMLEIVEAMPGYKIFDYDGIETIYYEYNHCAYCTSPNVQGSRFCSQCGSPLQPDQGKQIV